MPNPATTIPPQLHDLDALETVSEDDLQDIVMTHHSDGLPEIDPTGNPDMDEPSSLEQSLEELRVSDVEESPTYKDVMLSSEISEPDEVDPDSDLEELEMLDKRRGQQKGQGRGDSSERNRPGMGRNRDRDRSSRERNKGRNRDKNKNRGSDDRSRGRNKSGRKNGKGRKGKQKNVGIPQKLIQIPMDIQGDGTYKNSKEELENVLRKQGKGKSKVSQANENEVGVPDPLVRYRSCTELICRGGGLCVPDSLRGGVRCQCPMGKEGEYCERGMCLVYSYLHVYVVYYLHVHVVKLLLLLQMHYMYLLTYSVNAVDPLLYSCCIMYVYTC